MSGSLASGKGHRDENFPVASFLIARRHRAPILAFYRAARLADDIADNRAASPTEKLARLDAVQRTLAGGDDNVPEALALRRALVVNTLETRHFDTLLRAFRQDVTQNRYETWADLMAYCGLSAAPVGRFVLDVHGEAPTLWPASDALCASLQIINHLQDCAQDYADLDRVYLPHDLLAAAGLTAEALGDPAAHPALRGVIAEMARRCLALLDEAAPLAARVRDQRLAMEIGVINGLAVSLARRLAICDPFSAKVRHGPLATASVALTAGFATLLRRARGSANQPAGAIPTR